VDARPTEDGMVIRGGGAGCRLGSGQVESHDDHRIAMAFAMAALRASGPVVINNCANVNTSFPSFVGLAHGVGLKIQD
jgi:3-phosphoshikimate 1-carboxyvinyltransferase